jgi:uncharacterized protein
MDVSLVLTHDCNLGCTYCFAGEKFRKSMSDEVMHKALDLGFSDDAEKIQLSFFGGEPLLEWEQLVRATELAAVRAEKAGKRLVLTVTTNGTLLNDERVQYLVEKNFFIGLSIDGIRHAHDATRPTRGNKTSFADVERGLDLLLKHGAWFETISVVDPANVQFLGESIRWLVDKGVPRVALNPNFSATWSDDDLKLWERGYQDAADLYVARSKAGKPVYINVIEDKLITHVKGGYAESDKCSMGHSAVAVAPSGNLYPCERMVEEDRDHSLTIGNVFEGVNFGKVMCHTAQQGPVNDECGGCGVQERCMSFCACANRAETGSISVAGGVQCWHEQMVLRIADAAGNALWKAKNKYFLQRVYAYRDVA